MDYQEDLYYLSIPGALWSLAFQYLVIDQSRGSPKVAYQDGLYCLRVGSLTVAIEGSPKSPIPGALWSLAFQYLVIDQSQGSPKMDYQDGLY
jgi:hypothetical protein